MARFHFIWVRRGCSSSADIRPRVINPIPTRHPVMGQDMTQGTTIDTTEVNGYPVVGYGFAMPVGFGNRVIGQAPDGTPIGMGTMTMMMAAVGGENDAHSLKFL